MNFESTVKEWRARFQMNRTKEQRQADGQELKALLNSLSPEEVKEFISEAHNQAMLSTKKVDN